MIQIKRLEIIATSSWFRSFLSPEKPPKEPLNLWIQVLHCTITKCKLSLRKSKDETLGGNIFTRDSDDGRCVSLYITWIHTFLIIKTSVAENCYNLECRCGAVQTVMYTSNRQCTLLYSRSHTLHGLFLACLNNPKDKN